MTALAIRSVGDRATPYRDRASLALVPLFVTMPLIYFPKVTESDTQPWILGATVFSFLFYWPAGRARAAAGGWNLTVSALVAISLTVYWFRAPEFAFFIRFTGVLGAFVMLWHIANRGAAEKIGPAVRATIVVWFVFGLYQTAAIRLNLPGIEFFGRYDPGRSGVPSLTAEPSFYGSLSVLQIMYLITEKRPRRNLPFIMLAVLNLLFSGSLLSFLLLAVPALRLPTPYKVVGVLLVLFILVSGIDLFATGFFARIRDLDFASIGPSLLEKDQSINWRFGHAWFTVFVNLPRELSYASSADFMFEYNAWASTTGLFLLHDSDVVLPSGGELLFRCGAAGAGVLVFILNTAWHKSGDGYERFEKLAFVIMCLLNPVSLANPFFVFYIHKRYRRG